MNLNEIRMARLAGIITEADANIGHATLSGSELRVDSNLLNRLSPLKLGLDHIGMGDFKTTKPLALQGVGNVELQFLRQSDRVDGFVGRAHKVVMYNDSGSRVSDPNAFKQLFQIFKKNRII